MLKKKKKKPVSTAGCGTFHRSMWLRLWQKHCFMLWHEHSHKRCMVWQHTHFSSNLFFISSVNVFWTHTVSPALKQALWEMQKKSRSYSPCLYDAGNLLFQSFECWLTLDLSPLPLLFSIYPHYYIASPIATNTINKYPDDSQICISSSDLQIHIQLSILHLHLDA